MKVLKERIGLGLGGLESQSASNLGQGHLHNMLAYAGRDDVQSQATYSPYHIDRGSSTGWLANTGSASIVGNPAAAHHLQTTTTLISPYSQSNLTEYGNQNPISKNQGGQGQFLPAATTQPTQSQTLPSQTQSQSAFPSQQQVAGASGISGTTSVNMTASSISQLPPDQQLHASQLLLAQKDQTIQR